MDSNTLISHLDFSFKEESVEFKTIYNEKRCPVCKRGIYQQNSDYNVFSINNLIEAVNKSRAEIYKSDSFLGKAGNMISSASNIFLYKSVKDGIKKDTQRIIKSFNLSMEILKLPIFHSCLGCKRAWVIHETLSKRFNIDYLGLSKDWLKSIFFLRSENNLCSGVIFLRAPIKSSYSLYFNTNWSLFSKKLGVTVKLNEARENIRKGKIKSCFDKLFSIDKLILGNYFDKIEITSSRYFSLEKKNISGTLSIEYYAREQNKIIQDLLTLISMLEKEFPARPTSEKK